MIELVDQLPFVDDLGEPDRGRPVDELEGHLPLRMHLPDHLEHQQLVEVRVQQRPDRGVDPKRVVIDAGCDIRSHHANLRSRSGRRQGRGPSEGGNPAGHERHGGPRRPGAGRSAPRRPVRHLPRRHHPPDRRVRRRQAAGGRRLQGRRAAARPAAASRPTIPATGPTRQAIARSRRSTRSRTATTSSRRAAPAAACSPSTIPSCSRTSRTWRCKAAALRRTRCHELVSFLVDVLGVDKVRGALRRNASPITIPARACASSASRRSRASARQRRGPEPRRARGGRDLLRLRRDSLRSSTANSPTPSSRARARTSKRPAADTVARRRPRLPDEHGGQAAARGSAVKARHVAEVLAGMADGPAIGEPARRRGAMSAVATTPQVQGATPTRR